MTLRVYYNELYFVIAESERDALDVVADEHGTGLYDPESPIDFAEWVEVEAGGEFEVYDKPSLTLIEDDGDGPSVTHPPSVWCEIHGRGIFGHTYL